jgi:putative acetyltransferase
MIIRRERASDRDAIRRLYLAAFETPAQADLVDNLRIGEDWIGELSLVAVDGESVIAHVVCSRASLEPTGIPVLGFGPLAIHPEWQGKKIAVPLMHSVISAAEARDEAAIILWGDPEFYPHFGFEPATGYGINPGADAPHQGREDTFFVRTLAAYQPTMTGAFRFAKAFFAR